jgi:hypothetical protein
MFITNDLRWDGFGAQYQSIIWSILWAECKGNTFYYSEIERMVNDTGNEKKFIDDANKCMNLQTKYPPVPSVPHGSTIFALKWPYFYKEIERNMEFFHNTDSFRKIQESYFEGKMSPFDSAHYHVAVHIRRPLAFDNRQEGTVTPDSYYINIMKLLFEHSSHFAKPLQFHIYSQGTEEKFEAYKAFPTVFHLTDDTFSSFNGMVFADMLITSASSFSYTAALLSKGEIVYMPFWHPPRAHWKVLA